MTNKETIAVIECVLTDIAGNHADKEMPEGMKRLFEALEKAENALEFVNELIGYIEKGYMEDFEADVVRWKLLKHELIELNNDNKYAFMLDKVK